MPVLRKSGVRAPWMPAPLPVANTDPLRPVSVVVGKQPTPTGVVTWLLAPKPPNTDP